MYVIIWEFIVRPEHLEEFVAAYKSDGLWAKLFARAKGYIGTELLSSTEPGHETTFLTIDRWTTAGNFTRFLEQFGAEYRGLDTHLVGCTLREHKLGVFSSEL